MWETRWNSTSNFRKQQVKYFRRALGLPDFFGLSRSQER
jgi:hypothetical protein